MNSISAPYKSRCGRLFESIWKDLLKNSPSANATDSRVSTESFGPEGVEGGRPQLDDVGNFSISIFIRHLSQDT